MQRQWRVKNAKEVCISDSVNILAKRNTTVERETAVLETTVEKFHPPWRSGSDPLAPDAGVLDAGATHSLNQPVIQKLWAWKSIGRTRGGGEVMGVPPFLCSSIMSKNQQINIFIFIWEGVLYLGRRLFATLGPLFIGVITIFVTSCRESNVQCFFLKTWNFQCSISTKNNQPIFVFLSKKTQGSPRIFLSPCFKNQFCPNKQDPKYRFSTTSQNNRSETILTFFEVRTSSFRFLQSENVATN